MYADFVISFCLTASVVYSIGYLLVLHHDGGLLTGGPLDVFLLSSRPITFANLFACLLLAFLYGALGIRWLRVPAAFEVMISLLYYGAIIALRRVALRLLGPMNHSERQAIAHAAKNPREPGPRVKLASAAHKRSAYDVAVRWLISAIGHDEQNPNLLLYLARLYEEQQKFGPMRDVLQRVLALELKPEDREWVRKRLERLERERISVGGQTETVQAQPGG